MDHLNRPLPYGLYAAIVSLPDALCERGQLLQERLVVFEALRSDTCGAHLEKLLAIAWGEDTAGWCEDGFIYNVTRARERIDEWAIGDAETGDMRFFESGSGGDYGVGPMRIHYWRAADVDLFVTPRLATRLRAALERIEALYAAEPARRRAAAAVAAEGVPA